MLPCSVTGGVPSLPSFVRRSRVPLVRGPHSPTVASEGDPSLRCASVAGDREMPDFRALRYAALFASGLAVGCGGNPKPQVAKAAPPAQTPRPAAQPSAA